MTQIEQQKSAKKFSEDWSGHGYEKGESQKFWIDLLCNVFGVQDFTNFIYFENRIKDTFIEKTITNFIDAYIPSTKIMIEQKSSSKDLREPIRQSDGTLLNPFQQAKKYIAGLPLSQHPRWVVTCNFAEFLVYDMEQPNGEPEEIHLENLEKEYYRLSFLTETVNVHLKKELELSIKAGEIVGLIYDKLLAQYNLAKNLDTEKCLKSLNMLCVRLVFCLYAEDAGIFGHKSMFGDYLKSYNAKDLRAALISLFKILDTKIEERDPFLEEELATFPYVNGGLFTEEDQFIPQFTDEIKDLLITKASADFNWSEISPTIFGAVFESTLNPETRRSGGMHYTSIENIHKVIDPLFLNDLTAEYQKIAEIKQEKPRTEKAIEFQKKLGSLKFLDPACGSGNFLTESYLSLRKLENKCLRLRFKENALDVFDDTIFVSIHQFYGIEINDFATVVAKTALWIAESQMMEETSKILGRNLNFLPLKSYANVKEGNALRMDWGTLEPLEGGSLPLGSHGVAHTTPSAGTPRNAPCPYDYIMGNPPFVGYSLQSKEQKEDIISIYIDDNGKPYNSSGKIDYVSAWYFKATQLIHNSSTHVAFVSTNSITQGEQVAAVFKPLYERFNIHIEFAYRTFRWDSESNSKAHVHCVIIGFSCDSNIKQKYLYDGDTIKEVQNINPYLIQADNIFIDSRTKPLCEVPLMTTGNRPADGGHLIIEADEYNDFIKKEPNAKKYIKLLTGAEEYINNKKRYCLWLVGVSPAELRKMPEVMKRIEACKQDRLNGAPDRQKLAETPFLFRETKNPETYVIVPCVSSEQRKYIPIGFLDENVIPTNSATIIPDATLYHFGILTSNVHMAWMRAVCGRLEMRYRYSGSIVYNNFPWCTPTDEQKTKIEQTAQAILDARAKYPDCSLADLYDETLMPVELRKAHQENDKAVMVAYGFPVKMTESACVAELFKMYEKLVEKNEKC